MIIYAKTIAKEEEIGGYTVIVFKNLDKAQFGQNYVMTVVCPNWQSRIPDIGDIGYLNYEEVNAGDKYWNGSEYCQYKYTNIYFIKFVEKTDNSNKDIIMM